VFEYVFKWVFEPALEHALEHAFERVVLSVNHICVTGWQQELGEVRRDHWNGSQWQLLGEQLVLGRSQRHLSWSQADHPYCPWDQTQDQTKISLKINLKIEVH